VGYFRTAERYGSGSSQERRRRTQGREIGGSSVANESLKIRQKKTPQALRSRDLATSESKSLPTSRKEPGRALGNRRLCCRWMPKQASRLPPTHALGSSSVPILKLALCINSMRQRPINLCHCFLFQTEVSPLVDIHVAGASENEACVRRVHQAEDGVLTFLPRHSRYIGR